ncbi:MAG: PAS domain S-box protein [Thermodesulfobacteriota bacterium]
MVREKNNGVGVNEIRVSGIHLEWHPQRGTCTFGEMPVVMMWVDTTLAGVMSGVQAMVGTELFLLALQSEGRKSVEADWEVISQFPDFPEGFKAIANIAAVAGWGEWRLDSCDTEKRECRFRVADSWEGRYQKALGVCWGSGMLAGKMAGYCSKLFGTNCWADQTTFIARGDAWDEFIVKPSSRSLEEEIQKLLTSEAAPRASMAVALQRLKQEIDERTRVEEALGESEERYRTILKTAMDGFWRVDLEGRLLEVNEAYCRMSGYCEEELLAMRLADLEAVESPGAIASHFQKVISQGEDRFETRHRCQDGSIIDLEVSIQYKPVEAGEVVAFLRDITARKRAEQELHDTRERLELALRSAELGTWDWKVQSGEVIFNDRWAEMLGYTLEEVEPHVRSWEKLVHPDDLPMVREVLGAHLDDQTPLYETEHRLRHKSGQWVWVLDKGKVIERDAQGKPVRACGTHLDISARKGVEEELNQNLREMTLLNQISHLISSSISLEEMVSATVNGIAEHLATDLVIFFLKEDARLPLLVLGPENSRYKFDSVPAHCVGECLCGLAARDGRPQYSPNISGDPRCTMAECQEAGLQSFAALPLKSGDQVIGILGLASATPRDFEKQSPLLETLAAEISLGLRNSLLLEEATKRAVELAQEITERQRAREELEKERDLSASIIDSLPGVFYLFDEEGKFLRWNKQFEEISGYSSQEIEGMQPLEFIGENHRTQVRQAIQEVFLTGESSVAADFLLKNGKTIPFLFTGLRVTLNHVCCLIGMGMDITQRQEAVDALRLNEQRLEALLQLNQMANAPLAEIAHFAMEEATRLTESKIGYIAFMNAEETVLTMHAWSKAAMAECRISDKPLLYPVETTGLWGEAVRQRKPIITNDYAAPNPWKKGYPPGHVNIIRHMNVPIFDGDKVVIVAGVGNKPSDYDESDIRQLTLLMEGMWRIVQRKEAEEELQREKEKYRILTEESPVGVALIGRDGNYQYVNPKFIEIFGYTLADIPTGRDWFAKAYPKAEDRHEAISFWLRDLQRSRVGESRPRTFRVTCKDGSQKIINFRPVTLETGNQLVIYEDITDLALANEALQEREETLSVLINSNTESLLLLDPQGTVLAANATAAARMGKRPEEVQGANVWDIMPKEVVPRRKARIAEVVASGKPVQFEDTRQDRYFSSYCHPVLDSQGKVARIAVLAIDLTDYKKAEQLLRESEQRYRLLVNQIPAVVYKGYLDWSLECFDQKIEEITGYSLEEFNTRQKTWLDLIFPEDIAQAKKNLLDSLKAYGSYVTEHRIRKKNGEVRWIQSRNQIIRNAAGKIDHISGVFFDITERKNMEEQLLKSQKMEAVGRLAGGVAHDFNNLLTAITGYSEMMMLNLRPEDPFHSYVAEIMKAANRGASLTNQLLAFSRRQILQPRVINLNDVVNDMEKMLRRLIGEDVDLVTVREQELGLVKADPGQIEQIIMNLAVNGRDAMPHGGKLTLETANVYLDQDYAQTHESVTPGPHVMLVVSDNGGGMDAETLSHIFEPFFTTKESGKGTGLGLATVYGIVKQSGGHIWVYSEPDKGTTFKVYLPQVEEKVKELKPKPAVPRSLEGDETILVVEDDASLRDLISTALRRHGFTMLEASNGGEALLICERADTPIHLLLTDVVLPQLSGSELAQRLQLLHPQMKVLYMSGYTEDAIVHHGVLNSEVNFIPKPFRMLALVEKIREVLDTAGPS